MNCSQFSVYKNVALYDFLLVVCSHLWSGWKIGNMRWLAVDASGGPQDGQWWHCFQALQACVCLYACIQACQQRGILLPACCQMLIYFIYYDLFCMCEIADRGVGCSDQVVWLCVTSAARQCESVVQEGKGCCSFIYYQFYLLYVKYWNYEC